MKAAGLILIFFLSSLITKFSDKDKWEDLYNGKNLSGWDTYLGPELDSTGKKINDNAIGLNTDPSKVFSIVKNNGENVIRISGEKWGGISSTKELENFHFQLMFKWGDLTWGQKKGKKKDSGLLYHCVGPQGADYGAWMRSQEFQIEETNSGDYWGVAGGIQTIPAIKNEKGEYVYDPSGNMTVFKEGGEATRHCIKKGDAELPSGQWNTLDLYCHGDTSVHMINGKVMMVLYQSSQKENGNIIPLTKGKIQIQSEGAEVFYKKIRVQPIAAIPAGILKSHSPQ